MQSDKKNVILYWSKTHQQYYYIDCNNESQWAVENENLKKYAYYEEESNQNPTEEIVVVKKTHYKLICFNSKNIGDQESLSDYEVELKNYINESDLDKIVHVSVKQAVIPNSSYIINQTNKNFVYNDTTLEIPVQNYDVVNLCKCMELLIQQVDQTCSVTFNKKTGKVTFASKSSFSTNFKLIGSKLGFDDNTDYDSVDNMIQSQRIANITGIKMCKIRIKNLEDVFQDGIAAFVLFDQPNMVSYQNCDQDYHFDFLKEKFLRKLKINLLSEDDLPIDFNGVNHTIVFKIGIVCYEHENKKKDFVLHDTYY